MTSATSGDAAPTAMPCQARALMAHQMEPRRPTAESSVRIRGLENVTIEKAVYLTAYENPDDDLMLVLPQFCADEMEIRVTTMEGPPCAAADGVLRWYNVRGAKVPTRELQHRAIANVLSIMGSVDRIGGTALTAHGEGAFAAL
eukprot:9351896-Heterocapsa_arctica.AAC.1